MLRRVPRGGTAVDIGAHKGAYSWWMVRGVGPGGRVVAVEPQEELAARLDRRFAGGVCSVFHGAVSDSLGTADLFVPEPGVSHGACLRGGAPKPGSRVVRVPIITLDALAEQYRLQRIDFIKCDAEGNEHAIFRGGAVVLERDLPGVLVECDRDFVKHTSDPVGDLWRGFERLGYLGWVIFKNALVPMSSFRYEIHQSPDRRKHDHGHNFLFAHPDRGA